MITVRTIITIAGQQIARDRTLGLMELYKLTNYEAIERGLHANTMDLLREIKKLEIDKFKDCDR